MNLLLTLNTYFYACIFDAKMTLRIAAFYNFDYISHLNKIFFIYRLTVYVVLDDYLFVACGPETCNFNVVLYGVPSYNV